MGKAQIDTSFARAAMIRQFTCFDPPKQELPSTSAARRSGPVLLWCLLNAVYQNVRLVAIGDAFAFDERGSPSSKPMPSAHLVDKATSSDVIS
jgi:hypothetical protein